MFSGRVFFEQDPPGAEEPGQAVNIRVYCPGGFELEWFRENIVFTGSEFGFSLPLSHDMQLGVYSVHAGHALTGIRSRTNFHVKGVE